MKEISWSINSGAAFVFVALVIGAFVTDDSWLRFANLAALAYLVLVKTK